MIELCLSDGTPYPPERPGIDFCGGVTHEASILSEILEMPKGHEGEDNTILLFGGEHGVFGLQLY